MERSFPSILPALSASNSTIPRQAVDHQSENLTRDGFAPMQGGWYPSNKHRERDVSELDQALEHLGNVLYYFADIHPDDRCYAVESALAFYNEKRPEKMVEPSGLGYQRIVNPPLPNC